MGTLFRSIRGKALALIFLDLAREARNTGQGDFEIVSLVGRLRQLPKKGWVCVLAMQVGYPLKWRGQAGLADAVRICRLAIQHLARTHARHFSAMPEARTPGSPSK